MELYIDPVYCGQYSWVTASMTNTILVLLSALFTLYRLINKVNVHNNLILKMVALNKDWSPSLIDAER